MKRDLMGYLKENLKGMAESHIDGWKSRYERRSIKDVKEDLYVNHDPSLEIENVEEGLNRKLTDTEHDIVVERFNKAVIRELKDLRGMR